MSYFPNHVGFQVPSLVGQSSHSFPEQCYPFESHHQLPGTDFFRVSPTKNCEMIEHVPSLTPRSGGRSAQLKGPGCKKQKGNAANTKQQTDEIIRQENKIKNLENTNTDYIHVRARRGQATDSHSLAERVRREKISERMQTLQALVPGCDKVNGKALKLDQIITYIQSLQTQVQYLSMKLASVSPTYDNKMRQDQLMEQEANIEHHDSPTKPNMVATAYTEHQLESSNLLEQVLRLFSQDDSDEILPWVMDGQTLTQDIVGFNSYELSNDTSHLY